MNRSRWTLVVFALAVIGLGAWGIVRALTPRSVTVAAARRARLIATLSATGVVESPQVELASRIVGRIEALLADEGDSVKAGQTVARLDSTTLAADVRRAEAARNTAEDALGEILAALPQERAASEAGIHRAEAAVEAASAELARLEHGSRPEEIEQARQDVRAARAAHDNARADYDRIRELYDVGAVARAQLDSSDAGLKQASAALASAQERLRLLGKGERPEYIEAARALVRAYQAELSQARAAAQTIKVLERQADTARSRVREATAAVAAARTLLNQADIAAPIAGTVGRRFADVGDMVGPQIPIFLITDNSDIWVTAEVDEEDLDKLKGLHRVDVTTSAFPGRVFPGVIAEVGSVAVPRGLERVRAKIVRAKVRLEEGAALLKPGMEVDVTAEAALAEDALLVPNDSVSQEGEQTFVLVVEDGVVRRRRVRVGPQNYSESEILQGVKENELVVVSGKEGLKNGQRVTARRASGRED